MTSSLSRRMSGEVCRLIGLKTVVDDPCVDGLAIIRKRYPRAIFEGSTGHYTFSISPDDRENIVAEAWIRHDHKWWIRIKD